MVNTEKNLQPGIAELPVVNYVHAHCEMRILILDQARSSLYGVGSSHPKSLFRPISYVDTQIKIDAICRRFLWAGKGYESIRGKCIVVAWPTVCRPKDLEGLGMPDLKLTNIALQTRSGSLAAAYGHTARAWLQLPMHPSFKAGFGVLQCFNPHHTW